MERKVVPILISMLLLASILFFPRVNALTPSVNATCVNNAHNPISLGGCSLNETAGHTIIVMIDAFADSTSCPPAVVSVSDSSNTFVLAADSKCQNQVTFGGQEIWIYYAASAASTATHNIVVTMGGTVAGFQIMGLDISAAPVNIVGPVIGSGTVSATGNFGTSPSLAYGNSVLVAGIIGGVGVNNYAGIGVGAGFTALQNGVAGCGSFCWGLFGEYSTSATVASPTTFPWTVSSYSGSSGPWLEMGIAIGPAPATVVTVAPCTFFQLQCWLYPVFFFGVYLVLVLGIARIVRIDRNDLEGFAIEALALGGLLAVVMGMLNIMVPLLISVVQVIRVVRN